MNDQRRERFRRLASQRRLLGGVTGKLQKQNTKRPATDTSRTFVMACDPGPVQKSRKEKLKKKATGKIEFRRSRRKRKGARDSLLKKKRGGDGLFGTEVRGTEKRKMRLF